jgi:hypothetical protein
MQYQSPFKVLTPFLRHNESLTKLDFLSLKKRILAEFELSGKTSIAIDGNEFSKNEIILLIDNLKNEKFLNYHLTIAKLPGLLSLLEKNEIDKELSFYDPYYKNEGFVSFLSPYLAKSLGVFLANLFDKYQENTQLGYHGKYPILQQHEQLMIEPVSDTIIKIIDKIKVFFADQKTNTNYTDLNECFSINIINTINILPPYYFAAHKESYIQHGIELVKYLIKPDSSGKVHPKMAKHIRNQLLKLKLQPETRTKIEQINIQSEEYYENLTIEKPEKIRISLKAKLIFLFILFLIVRLMCK